MSDNGASCGSGAVSACLRRHHRTPNPAPTSWDRRIARVHHALASLCVALLRRAPARVALRPYFGRTLALALLLSLALACSSSTEEGSRTPKARLVFSSPTPTLPTATPRPPDYLSSLSGGTPTAAATDTSVPAEPPPLAPADLMLTLDDFPAGFEELPPGELGLSAGMQLDQGFTIESFFSFLEPENLEIVFGFTVLIPTRLEQARFDRELRDPELLLDPMIAEMGEVEVLDQRVLPDLNGIGDGAAGATVAFESEGIAWRLDLAVFRRGSVGAFVAAMYWDSDAPACPVREIAQKLDERLEHALGAAE